MRKAHCFSCGSFRILNEEVKNNQDIIKQKVINVFNSISENDIGYVVGDMIKEVFIDRINNNVN